MSVDQSLQATDSDGEETVEEWRIVPEVPHPCPDVDEPYTASPGPSDGLTEDRAKELARGRNRAGEPSPNVTWRAEPTGNECLKRNLQ